MNGINILKDLENKFKQSFDKEGIDTPFFTNFEALDKTVGGLKPRQLIFLGARPGMGKTTLAINIMNNLATQLNENEYVLFLSLEMSDLDIYKKFLMLNSCLTSKTLNNYFLNKTEENIEVIIDLAKKNLNSKNILVFDNSEDNKINPEFIFNMINNLKMQNKFVRAVVIDYFQLMDSENQFSLEHEKYATFSRKLKSLAKKANINVFALTQLSRELEKRKISIPNFSDLKGTSSIEQDADVILFLYDTNNAQNNIIKSLKLTVAKNRNGNSITSDLMFNSEIGQFYDAKGLTND